MFYRQTLGSSGQVVSVEVAHLYVATMRVDGVIVGFAKRGQDNRTLVPLDGESVLPSLGEATRADDCAIYEELERELPPAPRMPRPGRYRGALVRRGEPSGKQIAA